MAKVGDRVRADCPNCGRGRWATVMAVYEHHEDADDGAIWANTSHFVLKCPACDHVVHQTDLVFSEDTITVRGPNGEWDEELRHAIDQWPAVPLSNRSEPHWLEELIKYDETLHQLLRDIYRAVAADLNVFAITGVRTAFDRITEIIGIDPAITFAEKLSELVRMGFVGQTESDHLGTVVEAGSAAAHRGWKPSQNDIGTALDILEGFIFRTYILRDGADKLKAALPPKQKRKKKKP